jgi:hypothetical protein
MLLANPGFSNIDQLPGKATYFFTVANADGLGNYEVLINSFRGVGAVSLVSSTGTTICSFNGPGAWRGSIAAGTMAQFQVTGNATNVGATVVRLN